MPHPVRKYVDEVAEKFGSRAHHTLRSRARGGHTSHSDYNLIVIADFKEKFLDRLKPQRSPKAKHRSTQLQPSKLEKCSSKATQQP